DIRGRDLTVIKTIKYQLDKIFSAAFLTFFDYSGQIPANWHATCSIKSNWILFSELTGLGWNYSFNLYKRFNIQHSTCTLYPVPYTLYPVPFITYHTPPE
ncbi:MAG: hypothetical protein P8185_25510, partial [Deltaproteobacteria bacterium]